MAISIQPVAGVTATSPTSAAAPVSDLISQLAQTDFANLPDTRVVVTLGTGEPATLIYNANGVLQEVLFDLAPTRAATQAAAEELAPLVDTAIANALAEETGIAAPAATLDTTAALFNPTVNLTQTQVANDLLFTAAAQNPLETPLTAAITTAAELAQTSRATETAIAAGVVAVTATNIPNPALTSLQAANQALANTTAATAPGDTLNNALVEAANLQALNDALINSAVANQALAALNTPVAVTPLTATTTTELAAVATATLNVTPAPTNSIAAAAQLALNTATTTTTATQPFATIPTTETTNNLLQNLLTQAANQALATISTDPNYANSVAALLLSANGARVRMVDDTGALLATPEPVGPIMAIVPSRAV